MEKITVYMDIQTQSDTLSERDTLLDKYIVHNWHQRGYD